ncbi:MAG: flagellar motor switch protein FliN [Calditrichaeota bacterium]|nr:flagellar motor switch protein FliN [Calditrichota bacterium]
MNKSNIGNGEDGTLNLLDWLLKIVPRLEATLAAMLERKTSLQLAEPHSITMGDIALQFPEGPVGLTAQFSTGFGGFHILLPRGLAASIADLAALGEGAAPFNEADHPVALKEVWAQIISAVEPDIAMKLGEGFAVETIDVTLEPENILALSGGMPVIDCLISIENAAEERAVVLAEADFIRHFAVERTAEVESQPEEMEPPSKTTAPQSAPKTAAPPFASAGAHGAARVPPVVKTAEFTEFDSAPPEPDKVPSRDITNLLDVSLPITIELGRTKMLIRDVLDLGPGSIIELDKLTGEPVDLYVNEKKFARGEVVVIEENFGVRLTELLKVDERLKALK